MRYRARAGPIKPARTQQWWVIEEPVHSDSTVAHDQPIVEGNAIGEEDRLAPDGAAVGIPFDGHWAVHGPKAPPFLQSPDVDVSHSETSSSRMVSGLRRLVSQSSRRQGELHGAVNHEAHTPVSRASDGASRLTNGGPALVTSVRTSSDGVGTSKQG